MIPLSACLVAPPGHLLVERLEMPLMRGRIHLPPGVVFSTRSSEAVIVSVGWGLEERFSPGESVFLSTNVGRVVSLGIRGERKLYRITPHMVLARIRGAVDGIENRGEEPGRLEPWEVEEALHVDEGTAEALR